MALPLNKVPPGLLDFFGIKAGGWGPRELGQVLVPQIDLSRWYLDNHALEVDATITASPFVGSAVAGALALTSTSPVDITNGIGGIAVPQTETWLVLESKAGWQFNNIAGSSIDLAWGLSGIHPPQHLHGFTASSASTQLAGVRCLLEPYWALPGTVFQPFCYGAVVAGGGSIALSARLRVARFRI